MPTLILSRTRPSLRWERISVSHSIATAASPTAAKEPDKYRCLIGAMSAHGPFATCQLYRTMSEFDSKPEYICSDRVLPSLTHMYGPAVRCKWFRRAGGERSCINVS